MAGFYFQTLPELGLTPHQGQGCSSFPSTISKPHCGASPFSVRGERLWGSWCRVVSHCLQNSEVCRSSPIVQRTGGHGPAKKLHKTENRLWPGAWVPVLGRTEDRAVSLVGGSQAGEPHEHLHTSSVGDREPLGLPSSLCSQVWPTELSTMTLMLCVTCVSSSTSCPSAARTRLPSESATTPGGW